MPEVKTTPTPTTATTPAERINNFKQNVLPGVAAVFPAYVTAETTHDMKDIVFDVKNSGAAEVPPLSPDD